MRICNLCEKRSLLVQSMAGSESKTTTAAWSAIRRRVVRARRILEQTRRREHRWADGVMEARHGRSQSHDPVRDRHRTATRRQPRHSKGRSRPQRKKTATDSFSLKIRIFRASKLGGLVDRSLRIYLELSDHAPRSLTLQKSLTWLL